MKTKKSLALEIIAITAILISIVYFFVNRGSNTRHQEPETTQSSVNQISYSPSTDEDEEYVASIKDEIIQQESSEETDQTYLTLSISSAALNGDLLSIGSSISAAKNGTCSIIVSDGSVDATNESEILSANTNSGCITKVDISALSSEADWTVTATANLDSGEDLTASTKLAKDKR